MKNNKKYIGQYDFNGNLNGYYTYSNGYYTTWVNNDMVGLDYWYVGYETSVNGERIGLDDWRGNLTYHIT